MQFLHTDPVCTCCFDICLNHKAKFYTACHTVWDQAGFSGEYFFKAGYATSYHPVLPWFQALHTAQCTLWYRFPAFCKYSGSARLPAGRAHTKVAKHSGMLLQPVCTHAVPCRSLSRCVTRARAAVAMAGLLVLRLLHPPCQPILAKSKTSPNSLCRVT